MKPGDLQYLSGFGAHHETEAVAGALPRGQNSPQRAPFGLYAEQLSRDRVHRAARAEPALVALPPAAERDAPAVPPRRRRARAHRARAAKAMPAPTACAGRRMAVPAQGDRFRRGARDARHQRRRAPAGRDRRPPLLRPTARWSASSRATTASCSSCRRRARSRSRRSSGRLAVAPGEIAVIPRGVKFRVARGRPRARLRLRELRRGAAAAGAGPDRRQRARQRARFPGAGGGLRGPRRAHARSS